MGRRNTRGYLKNQGLLLEGATQLSVEFRPARHQEFASLGARLTRRFRAVTRKAS